MTRFRYLSFLTDYGLDDGFVAACHGVAARIAPHASVIDVTHLVPAGDVRRGAAVLAQTVPYLPPAVHVAVVDPGVGTARRGVAVTAGDSVFVGPDNGLLSWAAAASGGAARAFSLTNRELWLAKVAATFHGRDIFMPVAAHLAGGTELTATGTEIDVADLVTLPVPESLVHDSIAEGEVLTVDRFGNVQLTITVADAAEIGLGPGTTALISCGRHQLAVPYRDMFGAVAPGELVAYADSAGLVSIAVNGGDAAQRLSLAPGARVSIAAVPQVIHLFRPGRIPPGRGAWHDYRASRTSLPQARPRPAPRRNLTKVSHRLTTGLAAARHPAAAPLRPAASATAGSVLRDAVAAVCVLIIVLVVALLVVRSGRNRGQGGAGGRARTRGQHENRRPAAGDTGAIRRPQPIRPGRPASPGWASPAGWQGGGIGEIRPILDASSHPAVAPAPRTGYSHRASRGAGRSDRDSGPPWAPAPQPKRLLGPLPVASAGSPPPEPGRGIRLPGDMAAPADAAAAPPPPAGFDLSPPADFDLSTAAFGLTPPAFGMAPPAFDAAPPDPAVARAEALPTRQDLGFAAAPVPADYSAPLTGGGPGPADPSYIWDLAATDVFPAATDAVVTRDDTSEADGS